MRFVRKKQGVLGRFLEVIAGVKRRGNKVEVIFDLVKNPEAGGKGWVARVLPNGEISFVLPEQVLDTWGQRFYFNPGELILERYDESDYYNKSATYTLYRVTERGLEKIASISFTNVSSDFENETVRRYIISYVRGKPIRLRTGSSQM